MWTKWLVVLALGACFDEGGDEARKQAALTTAQGLIAFRDIHNNLTTDPGLAAEGLLEFIKTPVAADSLISPPIDLALLGTAQLVKPTPIPECLSTRGVPGCDAFSTAGTCDAGGFSFTGWASRTCNPCTEVEGTCTYNWSFPKLTYTSTQFTLDLSTHGRWVGSATSVTPMVSYEYDLDGTAAGTLGICACGPLTVKHSQTPSGKPRKLVNSTFVVRATPEGASARCAAVHFDEDENVTVGDSCTCPDGAECIPAEMPDLEPCPGALSECQYDGTNLVDCDSTDAATVCTGGFVCLNVSGLPVSAGEDGICGSPL